MSMNDIWINVDDVRYILNDLELTYTYARETGVFKLEDRISLVKGPGWITVVHTVGIGRIVKRCNTLFELQDWLINEFDACGRDY